MHSVKLQVKQSLVRYAIPQSPQKSASKIFPFLKHLGRFFTGAGKGALKQVPQARNANRSRATLQGRISAHSIPGLNLFNGGSLLLDAACEEEGSATKDLNNNKASPTRGGGGRIFSPTAFLRSTPSLAMTPPLLT